MPFIGPDEAKQRNLERTQEAVVDAIATCCQLAYTLQAPTGPKHTQLGWRTRDLINVALNPGPSGGYPRHATTIAVMDIYALWVAAVRKQFPSLDSVNPEGINDADTLIERIHDKLMDINNVPPF